MLGVSASGQWDTALVVTGMLTGVLAQATANVLNDVEDDRNGTDAINVDRISPFTGGSRLIQDQRISASGMRALARVLLVATVMVGLYVLISRPSWPLLVLGLLGLTIGWAYSAPPLKLMCRGVWGEVAIVSAWASLVVGCYVLATGQWSASAVGLGIGFGALVATILFANQIPDIRADQKVGKQTLAVVTPAARLWLAYAMFLLVAYGSVSALVQAGWIPFAALLAWIGFPFSWRAAMGLRDPRAGRAKIQAVIVSTILAAHLYGLGLIAGLLI